MAKIQEVGFAFRRGSESKQPESLLNLIKSLSQFI
jgi:hypothetical protein